MSKPKRSKSAKTAAAPLPKAVLTAGEYQRLIQILESPLLSVPDLAAKAATDPWCEDRAAANACRVSGWKLMEFTSKLSGRFKAAHSEGAYHCPVSATIEITARDADDFEEALAPACSMMELCIHNDFGGGLNVYIGSLAEIVLSIAKEGRTLLRSRTAVEGGAQ
jgi:hypothetical protein